MPMCQRGRPLALRAWIASYTTFLWSSFSSSRSARSAVRSPLHVLLSTATTHGGLERVRIPITERTMLRVAPGCRPPQYPRAHACALAAHAAHAPRTPRTPRARRARTPRTPRTRHYAAHYAARARSARTPHYAALRGTMWRFADLSREPGRFEIPCKGMPRYAAGRDGVRSCAGQGVGYSARGRRQVPEGIWGWAPPWGYP